MTIDLIHCLPSMRLVNRGTIICWWEGDHWFGPHIWNSHPQDLRHCSTLSSFKAKLKTFLLIDGKFWKLVPCVCGQTAWRWLQQGSMQRFATQVTSLADWPCSPRLHSPQDICPFCTERYDGKKYAPRRILCTGVCTERCDGKKYAPRRILCTNVCTER